LAGPALAVGEVALLAALARQRDRRPAQHRAGLLVTEPLALAEGRAPSSPGHGRIVTPRSQPPARRLAACPAVQGARGMSRRELLAAAGIGAGALALAPFARAKPPAGLAGGLAPELLTVTPNGFAAWWPTDSPADSSVRISRANGSGAREL